MTASDDFIREERRYQKQLRDEEVREAERRRMHRQTIWGYVLTALVCAAIGIAIALGIKALIDNNAEREHEERLACYESGGSLITLGNSGESFCLIGVEEVR